MNLSVVLPEARRLSPIAGLEWILTANGTVLNGPFHDVVLGAW